MPDEWTEELREQQKREIAGLLRQAGVSRDEFARALAIDPDTLRKQAGGYQKVGKELLLAMKLLSQLLELKREKMAAGQDVRGVSKQIKQAVTDYLVLHDRAPEDAARISDLISSMKEKTERK